MQKSNKRRAKKKLHKTVHHTASSEEDRLQRIIENQMKLITELANDLNRAKAVISQMKQDESRGRVGCSRCQYTGVIDYIVPETFMVYPTQCPHCLTEMNLYLDRLFDAVLAIVNGRSELPQ